MPGWSAGGRAHDIAGVVLAAGSSTRMGFNKLLLAVEGETLLRRAVRTGLEAGLQPLVVVLGFEEERAREELRGLACVVVQNARFASGMNTSVAAGFAAVPDACAGAVLLLADMPRVRPAMIAALKARFRGEAVVASKFGGVVAPPILYARAVFDELRSLEAGDDPKRVLRAHLAAEVDQPAEALRDLDVPSDLTE